MCSAPQYIVADRVWDGTSRRALERAFVRVADGLIDAVGGAADLPTDAVVRDLGDVTLLPGLINAHVHLTFSASLNLLDEYFRERDAGVDVLRARAEDNMRRAIGVGVTTVRDLGTLNEIVFAVREDVRRGALAGPDVVAAGEGITSHKGHCYFFGIEAEGVDAVRAAVRRQHEAGADVIKVFATGGNLTPGTNPFAPQYGLDELRAVVEEANARGLPVASHAHATEGIRRSVAADVNTIEHCTFETSTGIEFDDRAAAEMAARGIAAVPTPGASTLRIVNDPGLLESYPDERKVVLRRILSKLPQMWDSFRRMRELGVTIISGTDAGIPNRFFDDMPADVGVLATDPGYGFGNYAALVAATSECARSLGLSDRGTLEPGKRADLLAVAGDPLQRIEALRDNRFVMCGGRVAVDTSTPG